MEEKIEMMIMWAPHPPNPMQIRKLIASPEDWDGDICGDPDGHDEGNVNTLLPSDSSEYKTRPIIKVEYSEGPLGDGQRYTMQSTPWDVLQLANLQRKYGRKPGESKTEYL